MEKIIKYFEQPMKVGCDENCGKAWGVSNRPKIILSSNENDFEYLADNELGIAPVDPKTYEGGQGKPMHISQAPNKWCVRECERCACSRRGEWELPITLPDFSVRRRNIDC